MSRKNEEIKQSDYFKLRNVSLETPSKESTPPKYLKKILPENRDSNILDIGCGFGHTMQSIINTGYSNVFGVDINSESINFCNKNQLSVELIPNIRGYAVNHKNSFDVIIMTHVIEHIKKDEIIETIISIKEMLKDGGFLYIVTPNGYARSGAYWLFEDFTHETIFTVGSLLYVLQASGYSNISIIDKDGLENSRFKLPKKLLLSIYRIWTTFWDKITGAAYHPENPRVDTWEIKIAAYK